MSLTSRMLGGQAFQRNASRGAPGSWYPWTGREDADPIGLVAVACAIQLISETIGSFVMRVYEGDAEKRQPVPGAPQAALLQDGAEGYCTSVDTWSDTVTSIELRGNAFLWKGRTPTGQVGEIYPFPAEATSVYVDSNGNKVIEARVGSQRIDITKDVIHVRNWSPIVSVTGDPKLWTHRRMLNGALALVQFRGRFFDNDSTPNLALLHPGSPTSEQRKELRDSWNARHRGPNGEKMALLWGGIDVKQLTSTLADAQVAQLMALDAMDVARLFRIHPLQLLLSDPTARLPDAETVTDLFHRLTLLPRMRRIERAISADRDVFPQRGTYCNFDSLNFARGSVQVAAAKVHMLKQVGVLTANEARAELGYARSEDPAADKLLETPVGAGANTGGASIPSPLNNGALDFALTNGDIDE